MLDKEILNSEEAADLLGVKPFTIRTYAKRGVIPGKKLGKEWRFIKNDLLAWLKGKGIQAAGSANSRAGAEGFLRKLHEDTDFKNKILSFSTDAERLAFVRREGFVFNLQELEQAIKTELNGGLQEGHNSEVIRKAQRYQVYFKVSELNGQAVTDTMILDINAWGARVESFSPFDILGNIEITFTPPGETQNVRLSGEVVWSRFMPADSAITRALSFPNPLISYIVKARFERRKVPQVCCIE